MMDQKQRRAVAQQARALGHQMYRWHWASDGSGRVLELRCTKCWRRVAIYGEQARGFGLEDACDASPGWMYRTERGVEIPLPAPKAFWEMVRVGAPNECWSWLGPIDVLTGYGLYGLGKLSRLGAHRIAFMLARGLLLPTIQVNHHCDNRPCCNPRHLYAGTQADNIRDMMERGRWSPWRGGRTTCFRGHPFTPENVRWNKRGNRQCRICQDATQREWLAKRRRGEPTTPREKLSREQILEIAQRHRSGESQSALAKAFNVSRYTVQYAIKRARDGAA